MPAEHHESHPSQGHHPSSESAQCLGSADIPLTSANRSGDGNRRRHVPCAREGCRPRRLCWGVRTNDRSRNAGARRQRRAVGGRPARAQPRPAGLPRDPAARHDQPQPLRDADGAPPQRRRRPRDRARRPARTRPRRPRRRPVRARADQVLGQPGLAAPHRRRTPRPERLLPHPGRPPRAGLPPRHAPPGHHRHRRLHHRHRLPPQAGRRQSRQRPRPHPQAHRSRNRRPATKNSTNSTPASAPNPTSPTATTRPAPSPCRWNASSPTSASTAP